MISSSVLFAATFLFAGAPAGPFSLYDPDSPPLREVTYEEDNLPNPREVRAEEFTIETTEFLIPVNQSGDQELDGLELYMSDDLGRTWKCIAYGKPVKAFHVRVPHNGVYHFALRVIHKDGTIMPRDVSELRSVMQIRVSAKPVAAPQRMDTVSPISPVQAASPIPPVQAAPRGRDPLLQARTVPDVPPRPITPIRDQVRDLQLELDQLEHTVAEMEIAKIRAEIRSLQNRIQRMRPEDAREQIRELMNRLNQLDRNGTPVPPATFYTPQYLAR